MAVSNELAGEKIDVVLWDENLAQYVNNAMEPAEVSKIIINEDSHTIDVAVADENLALAIGRNGQNVRLASQILGWNLKVMTESEMEEGLKAEEGKVIKTFVDALNIDDEFAEALSSVGFTTLEEIAYVPIEEFESIEGIDRETATILQENARRALAEREEKLKESGSDALTKLEGIDSELAMKLVAAGIKDPEELAEQAVDDLLDIEGMTEEKAGQIIMAARNECWFKDEQ